MLSKGQAGYRAPELRLSLPDVPPLRRLSERLFRRAGIVRPDGTAITGRAIEDEATEGR
jgi:hypothetical protein